MQDIDISPGLQSTHHYLKLLSASQRDSEQIVYNAISGAGQFRAIQYASPRLLSNAEFMVKILVLTSGLSYMYCAPELKRDPEFALLALKLRGVNFKYTPDEVFTPEFCTRLLAHLNQSEIPYSPLNSGDSTPEQIKKIKSTQIFLRNSAFVEHAAQCLLSRASQLLAAPGVIAKILVKSPKMLEYLESALSSNLQFLAPIIYRQPSILYWCSEEIRSNRELILKVIESKNGRLLNLSHLHTQLLGDKDLILKLMSISANAFEQYQRLGPLMCDTDILFTIFSRAEYRDHNALNYSSFYNALPVEFKYSLVIKNDSICYDSNYYNNAQVLKKVLKNADWKNGVVYIFQTEFNKYIDSLLASYAHRRTLSDHIPAAADNLLTYKI